MHVPLHRMYFGARKSDVRARWELMVGCSRVDELRAWIEQKTRLPAPCQILMTARGTNVKSSTLSNEVLPPVCRFVSQPRATDRCSCSESYSSTTARSSSRRRSRRRTPYREYRLRRRFPMISSRKQTCPRGACYSRSASHGLTQCSPTQNPSRR